ncbi:MAG: hypothetical protein M0Q22_10980 [Sulfuritalea sp.]|nr:hypothetical protein [Sulfuritalea sp.]
MFLAPGSMSAIPSIHLQTAPDIAPPPAEGCLVGVSQHLLQAVSRISREWAEHFHADDLQRSAILHLGSLAEDISDGNASALAMTQLRALLCGNCRRLDAAEGACSGQSLNGCRLLKEPGS